jgi:putative addiction module component (TIGR02574 family)
VAASGELCYLVLMSALNLDDVFKLPPSERLRIAAAIWDSVADQPEQLHLTQAQAQELDARYADYLAHPEEGASWAAVKSQIQSSR